MTTLIPKYDQGATSAVNRPINQKLAESVSVKDFGAVGDGTTDDTVALRAAFAACFPSTPTYTSGSNSYYQATCGLYFPPGKYRVTSTVYINSSTPGNVYYEGLSIYGLPSATVYDLAESTTVRPTAMIMADSSATWIANQAVLSLQYCNNCSIQNISVYGVAAYTKGIDFSHGAWWTVKSCTIANHLYGAYHNASGGLTASENQYTNCTNVGLYMKDSGDSNIFNCYINTNNPNYTTDISQGNGIYLATSNNTNIHGGKNEYNAIGIYVIDTQGINISGINFDANFQNHIIINSSSNSATPDGLQAKSINIVGNRFLAGGFNGLKSTIYVGTGSADSHICITGNSFRKGSTQAFDENPSTGGSPAIGPLYALLTNNLGSNTCYNTYAISGNDMWNCCTGNTIYAGASSGANAIFKGINIYNVSNGSTGANVNFTNFL